MNENFEKNKDRRIKKKEKNFIVNQKKKDEDEYMNYSEEESEDFSEEDEEQEEEEEEMIEDDLVIFGDNDDDDYDDSNMDDALPNDMIFDEIINEEEPLQKKIIDFEYIKDNYEQFNFKISKATFNYTNLQWKSILKNSEEIFQKKKGKKYLYENLFKFNGDNQINNRVLIIDFFIILISLKLRKKISIMVIEIIIKILRIFPNFSKKFPKTWKKICKDFLGNFPINKIAICGFCNTHVFLNTYKNEKNEILDETQKKIITCPECYHKGFIFKNKKWLPIHYIYHFNIGYFNFFYNLI
jgi:hypothetical protein